MYGDGLCTHLILFLEKWNMKHETNWYLYTCWNVKAEMVGHALFLTFDSYFVVRKTLAVQVGLWGAGSWLNFLIFALYFARWPINWIFAQVCWCIGLFSVKFESSFTNFFHPHLLMLYCRKLHNDDVGFLLTVSSLNGDGVANEGPVWVSMGISSESAARQRPCTTSLLERILGRSSKVCCAALCVHLCLFLLL